MNYLAKLTDATRMLAEVRDATDAKKLMDLAAAAEHYAHKAKLGEKAIQFAHEIKIDAETMLGGFLEKAEKNKGGGDTSTGNRASPVQKPPTLADLGLTKNESSEAQMLARLKREAPEQHAAIRSRKKKKTQVRREMKRAEVQKAVSLPDSKFRVLYGDPPYWPKCEFAARPVSKPAKGAKSPFGFNFGPKKLSAGNNKR